MAHTGLMPINPLTWTSKYGGVVAAAFDLAAADGINERGLAGSELWLSESNSGAQRDAKQPGLALSLWLTFFLDNFAAVTRPLPACASIRSRCDRSPPRPREECRSRCTW